MQSILRASSSVTVTLRTISPRLRGENMMLEDVLHLRRKGQGFERTINVFNVKHRGAGS